MSDDALQRLETWIAPLLQRMQPAARRTLARQVGTALQRSQNARIGRQENPDGSAYVPRKASTSRGKAGRVKRRAMFAKLRTAKHLKLRVDDAAITIGFLGRVSRIARVHQEGGTDMPRSGGRAVRYARRELLGFSADDIQLINDQLIAHLSA